MFNKLRQLLQNGRQTLVNDVVQAKNSIVNRVVNPIVNEFKAMPRQVNNVVDNFRVGANVTGVTPYVRDVATGNRDILPNIGYRGTFKQNPIGNSARSLYGFGANIGNSIGSEGIIKPVNDTVENTVRTIQNKPLLGYNQLKSGAAKVGYDVMGQGATNIQGGLADAGKTVMPIINAWGGGKAKGALETASMSKAAKGFYGPTAQKAALWQLAKKGAVTGAKVGASFGAAQGVQDNKDLSLKQDLLNTGKSAVTGGAMGAVIGGAVPYAGAGANELGYQVGKEFNFAKSGGARQGFARIPGMSDEEYQVQRYLKNAYKVYSGQKPANIIAKLSEDVANKTNLPKDVVVKRAFFDKMAERHPEIDKNKLFAFVRTTNIPDSVYQLPQKEKLNFFRQLENEVTNIVGTHHKGDQQVVTSFITTNKNYPDNIKKTSEEVFSRNKGGALGSSSLMQSPPAGALPEGISGVNVSNPNIPQNSDLVNRINGQRPSNKPTNPLEGVPGYQGTMSRSEKVSVPENGVQKEPGIPESMRQSGRPDIPATTVSPATSQKPIEINRQSFDNTIPPNEQKINPLLLQSGKKIATTPAEAKRLFKQGRLADTNFQLKSKDKPFIFSEKNGQSKDIKVRVMGGDGKEVTVKINALNDVSPETVKEISGVDASFKSVYRNFEKAFGNRFEAVKRRILDPFDASKGAMVREQEQLASNLQENIVKKLGIGKGSKESALVQQFGEGKISLEQLKSKTNKWQNIVDADKWFRAEYDRILGEVNATRAKIYPDNLDKQIPRRSDYYRHFQELTGLGGLKNIFDSPANIPTELAGVSDTTQPKSKWLSFAQKRLGFKTKEDAVGGFINYMRSATYAKHIDQHIEKFRGLADELTAMAERSDNPTLGSRFAEYLRDYANDLSGKTNPLDRSVQKVIGRKSFAVINWLNSRVKANVILANLSSSVAQAGNTPQMMAKAGYKNWARGFTDTLNPKNKTIGASDFIKERYSNSIFDQFDTRFLDQPKKLAVWITQSLDELATKIGWNGFYRQAVEKGIANPTKYADDMARSMVGGRGIGEVPLIQKSKVTQLIAPFQLEVQNLMQVLGKEASNKEIGVLLKYALAAYGFNLAAKQIRGNGVTFDPVQASVDAIKAYREEDNKGIGAMRAVGRLGGELFSNVMGGQQIASLYPEYGVKVGGETVTRKELFGSKDPTRFGSGLITSGIQNPLYKILPSFGGSQLEKTINGVKAYAQGYAEDKGKNIQYMVDKTPANLAKSIAFGKYATDNAREYFDKQRTALSEKQTGLVKAGAKSYQDIITERINSTALDKLKEGKTSKGTEDLGNGLYKVGDKFYSKTLDREFKTQKEADKAVALDTFDKSGQDYQQIGDTFYSRNKDGSPKETPIADIQDKQYDLNYTLKLEQSKRNNDVKGWFKLQDDYLSKLKKEYNGLDKNNPLDAMRMTEIENKVGDISTAYQKYKSYGGFTKPKAAKKIKLYSASQDNSNALASSTYKNLQRLLGGTSSRSTASTGGQIGRKVQLKKYVMKGA